MKLKQVVSVVALAGVSLVGCSEVHRTNWDRATPRERARAITDYRAKAAEAVARYVASEGQDVQELEKAVEYERITTEISPGGCPTCFREYGEALSRLGHHYRLVYEEILEEIELAESPAERAELEAEARDYYELLERNFRDSNRSYRIYFANPGTALPRTDAIERVMRHHEYLGEYEEALRYLNLIGPYATAGLTEEDKQVVLRNIAELRRFYERRVAAQRERRYRETVENRDERRDETVPPRVSPGSRTREPESRQPETRRGWRRR